MLIPIEMSDDEIEETCNECFFYWDCHKFGFDLDIAKDCDNINYTEEY